MEQLCWIVHRPQCRTVHQTLVYPASSVQGSGMSAKCLVVCGLIDWRGLIFTQERHRGRCGIRDGLQSAKEITKDSREDRVISTAIIHLTGCSGCMRALIAVCRDELRSAAQHAHSVAAMYAKSCLQTRSIIYVGSRRVQNNLSPKIVVKSHHYPFARIDCLSDVADTRSTDTRHKSAKFAKNMLYRYKLPTTWRYMTYY